MKKSQTTKKSRFDKILDISKDTKKPVTKKQKVVKDTSELIVTGKRSHSDYTQISLYVRKDTHKDVKRELFDDPDERDFSELAEELFSNWLKSR